MKKTVLLLILFALLCGCSSKPSEPVSLPISPSDSVSPSPSLPVEIPAETQMPENYAKLIGDIDTAHTFAYSSWVNLEGHFIAGEETETVSFYLHHNTDLESDSKPCYYMFIETGGEVLHLSFADDEAAAIASVDFCDMTGDGTDEIIISLSDVKNAPLYILSASQGSLRVLFSASHVNLNAGYPANLGFSGTCGSDLQAVIGNEYTGMSEIIDLTDFVRDVCLYDETTVFDDEGFGFELLSDASPLEFSDMDGNGYALKVTMEARLYYSKGDVFINEAFALVHAYLNYDPQSGKIVVSKSEIELIQRT